MPHDTIHEAAAALRRGDTTPVDLVRDCFARIDEWEPKVRAWVLVDRDLALAQAELRTRELKAGQDRGPLHGIPLGVKDIFDVADWPTAAGSRRWAGSIAREDAPIVARLRQAGAIFLGKTVTTAFASFDPPVTRNPCDLDHTPGGSSSGSAAAVATRMCLGALGSQTGGSITRPASYCGVAGCKPSYGLLPLAGIVPLAPSMDHPGPIARCVRDLRTMLEVMGGISLPTTAAKSPRLLRIRGIFEKLADESVRSAFDATCGRLRAEGVEIEEFALPASFDDVIRRHRVVMAVESATWHRERFARYPDDYPPRIRELIEEGLRCPPAEYAATKDHQRALSAELAELPGILLTPATTGPAPLADTTGNPAFNSPWSYVGLPTVSFPTGQRIGKLPLAIQLVGSRLGEAELFAVAERCESALTG